MLVDERVDRTHGDVFFDFRRSCVGVRRDETEQGGPQASDDENGERDDNAEDEASHESPFDLGCALYLYRLRSERAEIPGSVT
jgi:hypothetical protein